MKLPMIVLLLFFGTPIIHGQTTASPSLVEVSLVPSDIQDLQVRLGSGWLDFTAKDHRYNFYCRNGAAADVLLTEWRRAKQIVLLISPTDATAKEAVVKEITLHFDSLTP